jgi:hypothetical protein
MKTIKFRLIKDNKVVGYEIPATQPDGIFGWDYQINYIPKKDEICGPSGYSGNFIRHDIKNQFIGIYDKKGKEIYEGDIVKHKNGIQPVEYYDDNYSFSLNLSNCTMDQEGAYHGDAIIIGNIYENPELLK